MGFNIGVSRQGYLLIPISSPSPPFTPLATITGQPAISLPLSHNAENLPVGVHFAARFGDEATLFRLAAQLEEAEPWAARRPPPADLWSGDAETFLEARL